MEWEKLKEKNREEDKKARDLLESIKETQARSAATQKRIAETLNGVKGTLKDIKDTNTKIDTFKK